MQNSGQSCFSADYITQGVVLPFCPGKDRFTAYKNVSLRRNGKNEAIQMAIKLDDIHLKIVFLSIHSHSSDKQNPEETVLTEKEFVSLPDKLRNYL